MAYTWTDPTGAAVTIYSVDGSAGIMTLDNTDTTGTQILATLDVEECEITFAMDWVSGAAGTMTPTVYYRAASDLSTFFKAEFTIALDYLTSDEITNITMSDENGVFGTATVSKTHTIGVAFRVKIRSTTNHFIKVWAANIAEPDAWDLVAGSGSTASGAVALAGTVQLDAPVPASLSNVRWMFGAEAGTITGGSTQGNTANVLATGFLSSTISSAGQGRDGVGYSVVLATVGGAANVSVSSAIFGTANNMSMVYYIYFVTSLPTTNASVLRLAGLPSTAFLLFRQSDSRLVFSPNNGGTDQVGPVVTTNTWYRIDVSLNWSATPAVFQWSVDGVAQTNATCTITPPINCTSITFGHDPSGVANATLTMRIDDMLVTVASTDYPIGELRILPLTPVATLTEQGTANALCRFTTNGGVLDVTFNAANILAAILTATAGGTADGVYQRTSGATNFVVIPMSTYTLAAGEGVGAVRAELVIWQATASANNASLLGNVGSGDETIIALRAPGGDATQAIWFCGQYSPTGGWDQTKLNNLALLYGGSTDISPVPGANFVFAEVAVRTASDIGSSTIDLEFDDFQVCSCEEV